MLIFVIDDEESVLKETASVIEKAAPDAEIMTFNRALQALEAIRSGKRPDIVFSDIEIPGISGLDFALQTKELSPSTRIVFITGYRDYAVEAFKIKAQGYLLKPVSVEDIKKELEYLPPEKKQPKDKLVIKCFGHFDVYWHGKPLIFARKQSKELLAYLIDREGAACTTGEIALALWQEGGDTRAEQNRIRVLINDLRNTLREIGMEDVLIREHRQIAIRRDLLDCDYYHMLDGDMEAVNAYDGRYMVEYSWAEIKNASIHFREG